MNNKIETKKILEEYFIKNSSPAEKSCPTPKKLLQLLRQEMPEKKKDKVVQHISQCHSCAREIKFIQEMLETEKASERELAIALKQKDRDFAQKKKPFRIHVPKLAWSSQAFLAAIFCIVLASAVFLVFKSKEPSVERSSVSQLVLIQPAGKAVPFSKLIFQWKETLETDYSILEIFDDSLDLLWREDRVSQNSYIPKEELKNKLEPGRTYLWMVTSFLKDGTKVESSLEKFTLKRD